MEKQIIRDKHGNKVGTIESSYDSEIGEAAAFGCIVGAIVIVMVLQVALAPFAAVVYLASRIGEGYRTPVFSLLPMLIAAIIQWKQAREDNETADWKMYAKTFAKVMLQCALPALLLGVLYGHFSGELRSGLIDGTASGEEMIALVILTLLSACLPGAIITFRMYRKRKKYRNTRTRVGQKVTLEEVAECVEDVYSSKGYRANVAGKQNSVFLTVEKKRGLAGLLLGLDIGVTLKLSWESEDTIKAEIVEKEWKPRVCTLAFFFGIPICMNYSFSGTAFMFTEILVIPILTGTYGAIKQGLLSKEVLRQIKGFGVEGKS